MRNFSARVSTGMLAPRTEVAVALSARTERSFMAREEQSARCRSGLQVGRWYSRTVVTNRQVDLREIDSLSGVSMGKERKG